MGTGYTRADVANNIANGKVIDADDLDNEFNAVEAAFNSGSGHTHDGTANEGAPITVLGPSQDIVATTSVLRPKTNNTVDLGTSSLKYKDAYLAGDLNLDGSITSTGAVSLGSTVITGTLSVSTNTTLTGTLAVNGNTTLGDAASDTVTVNADVASNLVPHVDDSYDLGAVGSEWRNLYIDGTANIDTAAVDTANVGTLAVSGNATVTGDLTVDGSINATVVGTASQADTLTTPRTITIAGVTSGAANFDGSSNITITTTGVTLGGTAVTATGAELNILDGATLTTAELNTLDGITASTTELNYMDGVTSSVQAQLDSKLTDFSLEIYTGDVNIAGELTALSYNESYVGLTSSGGNVTVDAEAANVFGITLSENTTFTFSNPPSNGTAYGFALKVINDASFTYTITWPSSVRWADSTAPSLSNTASAVDQFVFYTHDGGTNWYGFLAGKDLG